MRTLVPALLLGCSAPATVTPKDAAGPDASDAALEAMPPVDAGGRAYKRVFVSSLTFDGAGVKSTADADKACGSMAVDAGFPGTFQAWLSDGLSSSPATRFGPPYNGPYVIGFDPTIRVAANADAFAQKLEHAIDVDEHGVERSGIAWTQTDPSGDSIPESLPSGTACLGWLSADVRDSATVGQITATGAAWTIAGTATCDTMGRIYCFEQ